MTPNQRLAAVLGIAVFYFVIVAAVLGYRSNTRAAPPYSAAESGQDIISAAEAARVGVVVNVSPYAVYVAFDTPPTPWAPDSRLLGPICSLPEVCPHGSVLMWDVTP